MLQFTTMRIAARDCVRLSLRSFASSGATPGRVSSLQPLLPEKNSRRSVSQKAKVVCPDAQVVEAPLELLQKAVVPKVKLYGPGPSDMPASVQQSLNAPLLGHLHPHFLNIMKDVRSGLQYVFQTRNKLSFALSGTGHAGMECAFVNLCERGDRVLIIKNGIWGARAADLAKRLELDVKVLDVPEGAVADVEHFAKVVKEFRPLAVFLCHGESSTGVAHPLEGFGEVCRNSGALLIVDTVASLGAAPFRCDDLLVDCVYSATQKCLNAPPGLAPMSFNDRAIEKIRSRKNRVPSFYFDALEIGNYWGCFEDAPRYHHTAPISTVYSLRAALSNVVQEGIENSVERHIENSKYLYQLLESNGFELFVQNAEHRLPCLTTVKVPEGVQWKQVNDALMQKGLEISGGLGPTAGKIWRIGTFGDNSRREKIDEVSRMFVEEVNAHRK
uniref:Alanine--glyoxylate aminotransferase n=1 Tax=Steinernema glaseri TaxID=37863 RepID=A0A1I7ZF18_9BILA